MIGYVELGRLLIWSMMLAVLVFTTYLLVRHTLGRGLHYLWTWLWITPKDDDAVPAVAGSFILTIWLRLLADLVLAFAAIWVFFDLAHIQISDMDLWASRLSEGLPVGAAVIKFKDVVSAVFAFIALLLLFRGLQVYIRRSMAKESRDREGANASVLTLVGYLGFIVALLVGFSALGLGWSRIALIASALSVGIGFGLQSVVNNFVSGLILLVERPIKIGDWVATAVGEGTVRHIGLRSTEIRSFDRAAIIIPNSDLITASLTNWTHQDKTGRVKILVGVAYDSDPEQVCEIILRCAAEERLVLSSPEPSVYWKNFGESSLDFELRVFTRNITNIITLETNLRFAIFKALKNAGIQIPFPQRDIHMVGTPESLSALKRGSAKAAARPKTKR